MGQLKIIREREWGVCVCVCYYYKFLSRCCFNCFSDTIVCCVFIFICLKLFSDSPCDFSANPSVILEYAVCEFPQFHL